MATGAIDGPTRAPSQRTFLGHPVGLYVLFFTEMWERFSYYGMRALLILYMVNYFKWAQKDASTIYKVYTSFVYVTPILGGYLADRYLGNRRAVIIGAVLMAIGHFLMAFEKYPIFIAALAFLILGNGFFKPNMSVQVGRLYPANDGRRDGAYTIFYMGVNLGAFLSPLMCGWLAENTVGGYHSGFTMAGIGMILGLAIYLLGQPLIKELPPDTPAIPASDEQARPEKDPPATEAEASRLPSVFGRLDKHVVAALGVAGLLYIVAGPVLWLMGRVDQWDMIMLAIAGFCLGLIGYVMHQIHGGLRDRVLAILVMGVFVMFFWAAYEQAGNVLNIWADQSTDRFLTRQAPAPQVIPEVIEDQPNKGGADVAPAPPGFAERFLNLFPNMVRLKPGRQGEENVGWWDKVSQAFNPVPTAWFQSINALAIFVIAPLFAWLWIYLDRRGLQPSITFKMALGLILMSASMAIMVAAAKEENQRTTLAWKGRLPEGIVTTAQGQLAHVKDSHVEPFHAGRLKLESASSTLLLDGVLTENERDRLIEETAPKDFREKVKELRKASQDIDGEKVKSASVKLARAPDGFNMKYSGLKKSSVQFRPEDSMLVAFHPLADKEVKGLLVAAGEPLFRATIHDLFIASTHFRVSAWWLFWSYILATLGELCLSPVGLSMVSKLAPAKFATMLMGVWLLTSAFGNFAAGALGEDWGTVAPIDFFIFATAVVGGAAVVLLVLSRWVTATMHGVK